MDELELDSTPDWQSLFFAHLATLLAPRSLAMFLFQKPTRVSPRPRMVALLTNGYGIDFRFVLKHHFNLVGDRGLGVPKALRRLVCPEKGWLAAPPIPTLVVPALDSAKECLRFLEEAGPMPPVWLSNRGIPTLEELAAGAWLDETRQTLLTRRRLVVSEGSQPVATSDSSTRSGRPHTRRRKSQ